MAGKTKTIKVGFGVIDLIKLSLIRRNLKQIDKLSQSILHKSEKAGSCIMDPASKGVGISIRS
ncbi:hypothetical protein [Ileibacterium valens]|uniref:hypothetical protein n=1 Tax=Ileibacterium valens TaxID=1862668 RepID=UPI0024BBCF75|nr:hypothetical protein [Ileibacterium valens]